MNLLTKFNHNSSPEARKTMCTLLLSCWVSGVMAFSAFSHAAPVARGTQIPVLVNVYKNAETDENIAKAIKKANQLFRQAGIQLVPVKPPRASNTGDADNNGNFTKPERNDIRKNGKKELETVVKNKRGIKIVFGLEIDVDNPGTLGLAVHKNSTVILRGGKSTNLTGVTLAHEVAHALTNENHSKGARDIMQERLDGTENRFTKAQIRQIVRSRSLHGKCATQFQRAFPAVKCAQGFSTTTEELAADQSSGASGLFDITEVEFSTFEEEDDLLTRVTLEDPLPENDNLDATYTLGFDIDNSLLTGILHGGVDGIDKIVSVHLAGCIACGTFVVSSAIEDTATLIAQPLPTPAEVDNLLEFGDVDPDVPVHTGIQLHLSKSLLEVSPAHPDMPVVATAADGSTIVDTATLLMGFDQYLDDPTFETFGDGIPTPGAPYSFSLSGLEANSAFDLFVNGEPVFNDVLDANGAFSGAFTFPAELPDSSMHFLTAQDESGEFAYNISCPNLPDPDQLHLVSPLSGAVTAGNDGVIESTVQGNFIDLPDEEVVFTALMGDITFNTGDVSGGGSQTTVRTDLLGTGEVGFTANSSGMVLVKASVTDTALTAYSFFSVQ